MDARIINVCVVSATHFPNTIRNALRRVSWTRSSVLAFVSSLIADSPRAGISSRMAIQMNPQKNPSKAPDVPEPTPLASEISCKPIKTIITICTMMKVATKTRVLSPWRSSFTRMGLSQSAKSVGGERLGEDAVVMGGKWRGSRFKGSGSRKRDEHGSGLEAWQRAHEFRQ